jgi:hypothetical protein
MIDRAEISEERELNLRARARTIAIVSRADCKRNGGLYEAHLWLSSNSTRYRAQGGYSRREKGDFRAFSARPLSIAVILPFAVLLRPRITYSAL